MNISKETVKQDIYAWIGSLTEDERLKITRILFEDTGDAILRAVANGDVEIVKLLLQEGEEETKHSIKRVDVPNYTIR